MKVKTIPEAEIHCSRIFGRNSFGVCRCYLCTSSYLGTRGTIMGIYFGTRRFTSDLFTGSLLISFGVAASLFSGVGTILSDEFLNS